VVGAFACESGRLGLILNSVIPKTLKMVFDAFLAKRPSSQSCAEDKETFLGLPSVCGIKLLKKRV